MTRPAILLLLFCYLAVSASGHRPPVAVEVVPKIMLARTVSDVRVKCLVDPKAENRSLIASAICDEDLVRSSGVQLRGADAPYATWFEWRDLPACPYAIVAEVERADGSRVSASTLITMPEER